MGSFVNKRDIYIIKNDINDKVYIGFSKNAEKRFRSHCEKSKDNIVVDKAIQKYGKDHFWYEILESQIENYREREVYYIKLYNSQVPNGYNIHKGGGMPPSFNGFEDSRSCLSEEDYYNLCKDLENTQLSFSTLGEKYKVSKRTIVRINNGTFWAKIDREYPIRKTSNPNGELSSEQINEIIDILQHSYRFSTDIGNQFGVSGSTIRKINFGEIHHQIGIDYPIRKYKNSGKPLFTYEQILEITKLLTTTNLSLREIARKYNVNHSSIININSGKSKRYRLPNYTYPLRKS